MSANIGFATLQIAPSMRGTLNNLKSELGGPLDKAGEDAGTSSSKKFGSKFSAGMKAAGAAIGVAAVSTFIKSAVGAASDVEESMSKVNVVFGESSTAVIDWSKNASTAMGQSQGQALKAVGTFGNLLVGFGLGGEQTTKMSEGMVQLATDMASFNNTSVDEALTALQSGLTGETEPLKKFGVSLNDAAIKAEAVKEGLISSVNDALTPAAKAQASYALILAGTTTAQGDFARTSGGLANQQKILGARFEDVKAKLGAVLLPIFTQVTNFMSGNMTPVLIALGVVLGVLFVAWVAGAVAAAAASIAAAAPFIAIGVAVAAVVAGVIYAYTHFETFRNVINTVKDFIVNDLIPAFQAIWSFITDKLVPIFVTIVDIAITPLIWQFKAIKAVITDVVIPAFQAIWNFITSYVVPVFMVIANTLISVGATVARVVGEIVGFVTGIAGRISGAVSVMWDGLTAGITAAKNWVSQMIDNIVGFATGLPGRIGNVFSGMWDGIKTAFKAVINTVIGWWNALKFPSITLPKVTIPMPPGVDDWHFGGQTIGGWSMPQIPTFDQGGIVPGAAGAHSLAVLQAGEMVLTKAQQLANTTPPLVVNNYRQDIGVAELNHIFAMTRLLV